MSSRLLRWIVLGFACLWFGMLVPVHQRGMIQLPGARAVESSAQVQAAHCPRAGDVNAACHKRQAAEPSGEDEKPPVEGNCAVCHFILGLHVPPPVTLYEARLGLLRERAVEAPVVLPLRHAALPFHGLDPPTV